MGINKVYRSLQEVFPQIDARLLKAVSIEHSKDADAAVETVLLEIIPFFSKRSTTLSMGETSSSQNVVNPSVSSGDSGEVRDGYTMNGGVQPSVFDDEGRCTPSTPLLENGTVTESPEAPMDNQNVVSASVNSVDSDEVRDGNTMNAGVQPSVYDDEGRFTPSTPLLESGTVTESPEATMDNQNVVSASVNSGDSDEVRDGYTMNARVQPSVFDDEGRSTPSTPFLESGTVMESPEAPMDNQNVVSASVNSEVSTEVRNGYDTNDGGQLSVLDADDGHSKPISDTYVEDREGVCNSGELTLSKNTHETSIEKNVGIDSHGEAAKTLSDKDDENILQIDGSSNLNTGTVSLGKCPENSIEPSSGNISTQTLGCLQDIHGGDGQTPNSFREIVEYDKVETKHGTTADQENGHGKSWAGGNSSVIVPALLAVDQTIPVESGLQLVVLPDALEGNMGELDSSLSKHGTTADQENGHVKSWADGYSSVVVPASLAVNQTIPVESGLQLVVLPDAHEGDMGELDSSLSIGTNSLMETSSNNIGTEDATLNTSMSNSNQIYMLEVLEEVIADAKNNKKTMFSTMQSVISLMKEVELKEQSAEQAKVEADMGDTDILVKVEELKEIIHHAKEANSMHAGEVYGEKSILTSELRELQSRVLTLSDDRDNSLDVLDEMRNALEVRLAEAENEIKSAEQRKLEKGSIAKVALAEQEMIMEEVVQESKILKQQAEDNAKLQEFLMDRGRLVDKLQGEIAVICQDVRLLKEKFDERIPLSKSLLSSHTSFILASSSNSSLNSLAPKQVELVFDGTCDSLEAQNKEDPVACLNKPLYEEKVANDDRNTLVEDGWELCDNQMKLFVDPIR